jgi:hypothetical protein
MIARVRGHWWEEDSQLQHGACNVKGTCIFPMLYRKPVAGKPTALLRPGGSGVFLRQDRPGCPCKMGSAVIAANWHSRRPHPILPALQPLTRAL